MLPIVVLLSGSGSNLAAMIAAEQAGSPFHICAVISNIPDAFGLTRAQNASIPTHVIAHTNFETRQSFEQALITTIDPYQPQLIVLAGFMRRLSPFFVAHYRDKILNIHPSLLPKYPGLHTHRRVLDNHDHEHGASIHLVTDQLDQGPLICQGKYPVPQAATEARLQADVHQIEHRLYPLVLEWFATKRLIQTSAGLQFDGEMLPPNGVQYDFEQCPP